MEKLLKELRKNNRLRNVKVKVEDSKIQLSGKTKSFFAKQLAQEIAMKHGPVLNEILVEK